MSKATKVTIGCDPEFGYIQNGGLMSASSYVSGGTGSEFGTDGNSSISEIRPSYGHTPEELVNNIKAVLADGYKKYPAIRAFQWKAGGMAGDCALGGHIHLGHGKLTQGNFQAKVGGALDKTLSVLTLMVEDPEEALNRRVGSGYGQIGGANSYRAQSHGVEYRTPPSWLTSPEEAKAVLSIAHLVAIYFEDDDIMDEAGALPGFDQQSYRECDKIGLLYYIPPIIKFLRSLPDYEKYEKDIIPLFKLIKNREIWSCHKSMIDTWGLNAEEKKKATVKKVVEYV